uniref:Uncharacterized protein LOC111137136 isoform X2 n=1 Tax=Crassostrea virginica TaxID=6565 RepID=A0A8B8EVX8_CRAVI|nr:uncharacterized protein LOC111137136 isoform X2 [Crassostrea virginica]
MACSVCVYLVIFVIYCLFFITSPVNSFTNDSGICERNKDGIKCCVDFKKNGNKCEGCIGYYGYQCVHKCDPGYYGFGCREKCSCVPCYNVNGSCYIETTLTVQSAQGVPVWPFIVLGTFGFLTFAAVLTVVVMDSRCTCSDEQQTPFRGAFNFLLLFRPHQRKNDSGNVSSDVNDCEVNHVNEHELPYDDVRESQMILDDPPPFKKHLDPACTSRGSDMDALYSTCHKV